MMTNKTKLFLILSGALSLISLGLFYVLSPSGARAETCITRTGDDAVYCLSSEYPSGAGSCVLKPGAFYGDQACPGAASGNGWTCRWGCDYGMDSAQTATINCCTLPVVSNSEQCTGDRYGNNSDSEYICAGAKTGGFQNCASSFTASNPPVAQGTPGGLDSGDQMCIITGGAGNDIPKWDRLANIGLRIDKITVPFEFYKDKLISPDGNLSTTMLPNVTLSDWNSDTLSDCNDDAAGTKDKEFSGYYANLQMQGNDNDEKNVYFIGSSYLQTYFQLPQTYNMLKEAILRSCYKGSIETTTSHEDARVMCVKNSSHKDRARKSNYQPKFYRNFSFSGCGPLEDSINFKIQAGGADLTPDANGKVAINPTGFSGSYQVYMSSSNPSATCRITGKDAITGKDLKEVFCPGNTAGENCRTEINPNEIKLDDTSGVGKPTPKSFSQLNVPEGIYVYQLDCSGVKNGTISTDITTIHRTIKVYVGDIPPAPEIKSFSIVTENNADLILPHTPGNDMDYYKLPINKTFQLKWNVENAGDTATTPDTPNAAPANPIVLMRDKPSSGISSKTSFPFKSASTNNIPQTINKFPTTGSYRFWLEASGPFGLKTDSQYIIIRAIGSDGSDIPDISFTADKTEIQKGDAVVLRWAVEGAKSFSINHEIGIQSRNNGTITVYPDTTTTYTLTAKNVVSTVPDTTKSVTITVKSSELVVPDIKEIVPPPNEPEIAGPIEGAPTEQITDLKVNGSDGPVTLQAPADFKLSWNLNAYCLATGSWLDVKLKAGDQNMSVKKNGKYTYSLYCPRYGSDSVEVNVVGGTGANANTGLLDSLSGKNTDSLSNTPMPVAEATISTDKINYSQNITVIKGKPTDIYIAADRDTSGDGLSSRDETGSWSDLMSNGGRCLYNTKLVKGTPQFDGMIESPASPQDCNAKLGNFIFNDNPGTYRYGILKLMQNNNKFSNIAYINITVENPPPPTGAPVIDLKINDNDSAEQILGTPANYNLTWNVTNADTCEASGSWNGTKSLQGVQNFVSSEAKDFTYTLTCVGQLGTTTKTIALKVAESPSCKFTALPPTVSKQSAFVTQSELSWKCDYADECSMTPDVGIPVKTYGSVRVSPSETTTYELTCLNSATSTKFDATVSVQ